MPTMPDTTPQRMAVSNIPASRNFPSAMRVLCFAWLWSGLPARLVPQKDCSSHHEAAKNTLQVALPHWQSDEATPKCAQEHSHGTQNSCAHIHLSLFPIFAQRAQSDGQQKNQKRCALRRMLLHLKDINHHRHKKNATADAHKTYQNPCGKTQS
jgi:hypothetical protein